MKLECRDCGRSFDFTMGEAKFYIERKLNVPKRCVKCREIKNMGFPVLKGNSFFNSIGSMGMPFPVEGGTTVVQMYCIQITYNDRTVYVTMKNGEYGLCSKIDNATYFHSYETNQISDIISLKLKRIYDNCDINFIPRSHYETIR